VRTLVTTIGHIDTRRRVDFRRPHHDVERSEPRLGALHGRVSERDHSPDHRRLIEGHRHLDPPGATAPARHDGRQQEAELRVDRIGDRYLARDPTLAGALRRFGEEQQRQDDRGRHDHDGKHRCQDDEHRVLLYSL